VREREKASERLDDGCKQAAKKNCEKFVQSVFEEVYTGTTTVVASAPVRCEEKFG